MTRASIDDNHHKGLIAESNLLSGTAVSVKANPSSGALLVQNSVRPGSLINYDYIDVQQTTSTVETYVYKTGGADGTVVQTIVITYVDATKVDIDTVVYS